MPPLPPFIEGHNRFTIVPLTLRLNKIYEDIFVFHLKMEKRADLRQLNAHIIYKNCDLKKTKSERSRKIGKIWILRFNGEKIKFHLERIYPEPPLIYPWSTITPKCCPKKVGNSGSCWAKTKIYSLWLSSLC